MSSNTSASFDTQKNSVSFVSDDSCKAFRTKGQAKADSVHSDSDREKDEGSMEHL